MKQKRDYTKPPLNSERYSYGGYWLKTNAYNCYGWFKALQWYLNLAKYYKSCIKLNKSLYYQLMKENLLLARKMATLYLDCAECPHGISITGLRLVKIH
jgi:hypothetical protein